MNLMLDMKKGQIAGLILIGAVGFAGAMRLQENVHGTFAKILIMGIGVACPTFFAVQARRVARNRKPPPDDK